MKNTKTYLLTVVSALALLSCPDSVQASPAEASDKAFEMAAKYTGMGYYLAPTKEGHAGFATTLEFTLPVNRGLDYVFIVAGDRFALDLDVWIESETGNSIVTDTRKVDNGLAGVRWRSDYNGTVTVVVHFAKVSSRCGWSALVGRRGTLMAPSIGPTGTTTPGSPQPIQPGNEGGGGGGFDATKP